MPHNPIKTGRDLYLWHFYLYHDTSKGKDYVLFLIHHSIIDGDSIFKMLQEWLGYVRKKWESGGAWGG